MSVKQLPLRVAVVGCGNISDIYLKTMPKFAAVRVVGVSDLDAARAKAASASGLALPTAVAASDGTDCDD